MDKLAEIRKDRGAIYGPPKLNHEGIAQMWASLLQPHWEAVRDQRPLPPHVVALLMAALKLNRMRLAYHEDNYDDIANYLLFAKEWQSADGEAEKPVSCKNAVIQMQNTPDAIRNFLKNYKAEFDRAVEEKLAARDKGEDDPVFFAWGSSAGTPQILDRKTGKPMVVTDPDAGKASPSTSPLPYKCPVPGCTFTSLCEIPKFRDWCKCPHREPLVANPAYDVRERIYVAGPFSAPSFDGVIRNVREATDTGLALAKKGHLVHVPHGATMPWHRKLPYEYFMELDFSLIEKWATALFFVGSSPGADRELKRAQELGLKIYRSLDEVPNVVLAQ